MILHQETRESKIQAFSSRAKMRGFMSIYVGMLLDYATESITRAVF